MAHPPADPHDKPPTAWSKFHPDEQHSLRSDDSEAWHAVTKILLFIVAIGLTLSFVTLILSR